MSTDVLDSLRYPIGKFQKSTIDPAQRPASIATLRALPSALREAVSGLSDAQLATPYRDGGWTVLQTVHHLADSHLNAYSRFRQALTQDWPTIYAYDEAKWAQLADAHTAPVALSLELLDGLHARWTLLLDSLKDADFERGFVHPENGRQTLEQGVAIYAWHSRHHTAHITELRKRNHW
ncbi:MAG TPA: bacillithiol transferase BstA [Acidisarcina sp.]|nr:bacillithiol transferase BstA [Acidisarcina sp.]